MSVPKSLKEYVGEALMKEAFNKGQGAVLEESLGVTMKENKVVYKENQTTANNSGLFTTFVQDYINDAVLGDKVIMAHMGLMEENTDLIGTNGFGSVTINLELPTIAVEVGEGGKFKQFLEGTESVVAKPTKKALGTLMTWELAKRGINKIRKSLDKRITGALRRKIATDIIEGLAVNAHTDNRITDAITYTKIVQAIEKVNDASYDNGVKYGFMANKLIIKTAAYTVIQLDDDWKESVYRAFGRNGQDTINSQPSKFAFQNGEELDILVSPFLTSADAVIEDAEWAGEFVRESDVELYEVRPEDHPWDMKISGFISYVPIVKYPKAIATINYA